MSLSKLDGVDQLAVNAERGSIRATFDISIIRWMPSTVQRTSSSTGATCSSMSKKTSASRSSWWSRSDSKTALEDMVGEFANELLSQAWRQRITDQNRLIIEAVTSQAFRGASSPAPALSELDDLDFTDEAFDDPLGISLSWEEKYGPDPVGPAVEGKPMGPLPPTNSGPPKRPELENSEPSDDE